MNEKRRNFVKISQSHESLVLGREKLIMNRKFDNFHESRENSNLLFLEMSKTLR